MTEFLNHHYEVLPEDEANVVLIKRLIKQNLERNEFTDPVEKAFFSAVLPYLQPGGVIKSHMEEIFALKRQAQALFPAGYALRSLEFAVDKQMRQLFGSYEYPAFFSGTVWWEHRRVFAQLNYEELHEDINLGLQSNMHNAYAIYPLLMPAYRDRLGPRPVVLDNGISFGLGLKKWLSKSESFDPIRVFAPPMPGRAIAPDAMEEDAEAQEWVNYLSSTDPSIHSAVGYDTTSTNPDDPEAVKRVFSHTFPMSESLRRPDEVAEFFRLVAEKNPSVTYAKGYIDATDKYLLSSLEKYLPGGADAGIYSAVFFQHRPETITRILENTEPYYKESAPLFIADFARADPTAANGLRFVRKDWWHRPGSFALFVIDRETSNTPVEIARFMTRRGQEMWLTRAGRQLLKRSAESA